MKKLTLFLSFMLTFLIACQLQKVTVDVYTPARLMYPPDIRTVLLTSRYVPATGPYEDLQWGAYESVDSLKWAQSESVLDTLAKRMVSGSDFLVKLKHYPRMFRHNEGNLPDPLPWGGLVTVANKEFVQSFMIIEGFDLQKSPVKITGKEGDFTAGFDMQVTLAIRVYEPEKMRLLDDSVYVFSSHFNGQGKNADEAENQLPDDKRAGFMACAHAADQYFNLIRHSDLKVVRNYFKNGDSTMVRADSAVRQGKWGRAESKWKWLAYNSPDSMIQAKASYNMALACEIQGKLNQAVGYARRSERMNPTKKTSEYVRILNERILDYEEQVREGKLIKKW